jgi:hypothetical protein
MPTKTETELRAISRLNMVAFCRDIAMPEGNPIRNADGRYVGRVLYRFDHAAAKLDSFRRDGRAGDRVWVEAPTDADMADYKARVANAFKAMGKPVPAMVRA